MSNNPLEEDARAWWKDQQANFPSGLLDKSRLATDLAQLLEISVDEALTYAPDYVPPETPEIKEKEGATMATEKPSMTEVIKKNLNKTPGEIHEILNGLKIEHSKSSISSMLATARRKAEENEAPAKKKAGHKPNEAKPAPAAAPETPAPAPQPKKAGNLAKVIEVKKELIAQLEEEVRILQKAQDILEAS